MDRHWAIYTFHTSYNFKRLRKKSQPRATELEAAPGTMQAWAATAVLHGNGCSSEAVTPGLLILKHLRKYRGFNSAEKRKGSRLLPPNITLWHTGYSEL